VDQVALLPPRHQEPWAQRRLIEVIPHAPPETGLQTLDALARRWPGYLQQYEWTASLLKLGTENAARRVLDLLCEGVIDNRMDSFQLIDALAGIAEHHPALQVELRRRYRALPWGAPKAIIEAALSKVPTPADILMMIEERAKAGKGYDGNLASAIREVAIGR